MPKIRKAKDLTKEERNLIVREAKLLRADLLPSTFAYWMGQELGIHEDTVRLVLSEEGE